MTSRTVLKIATYNLQSGAITDRYLHYVTRGWHNFAPHKRQAQALARGGEVFVPFQLVALQEIDGGSWRSGNINQLEHLADLAGFRHHEFLINRNFGRWAQHGLGLLSTMPITRMGQLNLPGLIPGRGALHAKVIVNEVDVHVVVTHLSLGPRAQKKQLQALASALSMYPHFVLMGDLNCAPEVVAKAFGQLSNIQVATKDTASYPSWRPKRAIDHIVARGFSVQSCQTLAPLASDHLPIGAELLLRTFRG